MNITFFNIASCIITLLASIITISLVFYSSEDDRMYLSINNFHKPSLNDLDENANDNIKQKYINTFIEPYNRCVKLFELRDEYRKAEQNNSVILLGHLLYVGICFLFLLSTTNLFKEYPKSAVFLVLVTVAVVYFSCRYIFTKKLCFKKFNLDTCCDNIEYIQNTFGISNVDFCKDLCMMLSCVSYLEPIEKSLKLRLKINMIMRKTIDYCFVAAIIIAILTPVFFISRKSIILFLYNVSIIIGLLAFFCLLYSILTYFKNKKKHYYESYSYKEHLLSFGLADSNIKSADFFIPLVLIAIILTCGPTTRAIFDIHNLKTESEGTYCYYVTISNKSNEYTLPAQIIVKHVRESEDEEELSKYWSEYYVEKVYFSNGGYLTFDDYNRIKIDVPTILTDTDNKRWECTLHNKHAYSPYVEEHSIGLNFYITVFIIGLIGYIYLMYWLLIVYKKNST